MLSRYSRRILKHRSAMTLGKIQQSSVFLNMDGLSPDFFSLHNEKSLIALPCFLLRFVFLS